MNTVRLASLLSAACAAVLIGANAQPDASPAMELFEKNIARQHLGTNLLVFDAGAARYVPTEAAATWLDDDVTTSWAPLAGKHHYLVQFSQPQLISNIEFSGRDTDGSITLYTGDSAAAPGDKAWSAAASGIPLNAVNNKRLKKPINKFAKFLLIETEIAEPKSIYGLHVYSEAAAANYTIAKRAESVDIRTIGEWVNNQTAFNIASLYAKSRVTFANSTAAGTAWQHAIDDNPETFTSLAPSTIEAGAIVKFGAAHPVSRIATQGDQNAKGKLDVYLLSETPEPGQTVNIEGVTPSATLAFDGAADRASIDVAETNCVAMALRWTPAEGNSSLALREVNAFADISLADFEVISAPVAIAKTDAQATAEDEAGKEASDGKTLAPVGEGKEMLDFKGGKEIVPPVALGPGGYRPGLIGFPPNVTVRPPSNPPSLSP